MATQSNKRHHFRLEYPLSDRPEVLIDGEKHTVVDISEKGMRFALTPKFRGALKSAIKGVITFEDGKQVEVSGTVLRITDDKAHCVVLLTHGVPLAKMMEEQRFLIRKYKRIRYTSPV